MKSLESSKCSMRDIIIAEEDYELFDEETGDLNKVGTTLCETFKKLDKHFRRVCYNGFTKREWDARHNNKPVQLPLDRRPQTVTPPPSQTAKVISLEERRRKKKSKS